MLKVIKEINKIEVFLKKEKLVKDYHIALKLDMRVNVLVKTSNINTIDYSEIEQNNKINIVEITQEEINYDPYYKTVFNKIDKIDLSLRRRLNSLLQKDIVLPKTKIPVVSFYSYKGGMGRTTTLATFAAYFAKKGKKIVILDFDFEAPGFMNYFDINPENMVKINGVAEYIFDKKFDDTVHIQDYLYNVSKQYTDTGEIYVMPAGNLIDLEIKENTKTNLSQYLEALSRLDFSNTEVITEEISNIFNEINEYIAPDIILIDSRTGFSDIFGITSFVLSDISVGFFGINNQTIPGLHYFIDGAYNLEKDFPIILVNSIISDQRFYEEFKKNIENYVSQYDELPQVDTFPIYREPILEQIGTSFEYKNNFITFSTNPNTYFKNLFDSIIEKIEIQTEYGNISEIEDEEREIKDEIKQEKINASNYKTKEESSKDKLPESYHKYKVIGKIDLKEIDKKDKTSSYKYVTYRKKILENYQNNKPNLYAEDLTEIKYKYEKFYFRKCMYDIFNKDRYLLIGGKGTGKTYLYRAFFSESFIKELEKRANKTNEEHIFIHVVSLDRNKRLDIASKLRIKEIENPDFFFERFWLIYIWNAVTQSKIVKKLNIGSLDFNFTIKNDTTTIKQFKDIINNEEKIIKIEQQLNQIDKKLKQNKNQKVIVLFDQLDFVVKPIYWDIAISPLIRMFRNNPYDRILPKIFLRKDLYQKLGNITNIRHLKDTKSILLEWNKEELFAFFFKAIFADSKKEFLKILKQTKVTDILDELEENIGEDNQINLQKKYLKPLVDGFFGRWSNMQKKARFGENYDWFYRNLENADKTISLRPFIELINEAVDICLQQIEDKEFDEHKKYHPILPPYFYAIPETRKKAVKNHFEDLASEEGNEDLKKIFDYINYDYSPDLRRDTLSRSDFYNLLKNVIEKYPELKNTTIDALKNLLINNGIVSLRIEQGGYSSYSFALLYKYFLGLRGKK